MEWKGFQLTHELCGRLREYAYKNNFSEVSIVRRALVEFLDKIDKEEKESRDRRRELLNANPDGIPCELWTERMG